MDSEPHSDAIARALRAVSRHAAETDLREWHVVSAPEIGDGTVEILVSFRIDVKTPEGETEAARRDREDFLRHPFTLRLIVRGDMIEKRELPGIHLSY